MVGRRLVVAAIVVAFLASACSSATGKYVDESDNRQDGQMLQQDGELEGYNSEVDAYLESRVEQQMKSELQYLEDAEPVGDGSAECEVGRRSCCDEGQIYTEIDGFAEPMCAIVVPAG